MHPGGVHSIKATATYSLPAAIDHSQNNFRIYSINDLQHFQILGKQSETQKVDPPVLSF